ncbi:unnamed protein product [Amoebophrya sp. A25]|nr:unnamed protein product [Amoebophrya sp. A25]|eukprot:GSA25T00000207001.1
MGRVRRLRVENFKSYHGSVDIGPFENNFTCIVGPNGSGKSNIVDAFGFVLGISARDLRGQNLRDLVHRKPAEPASVVDTRDACVELEFVADKNSFTFADDGEDDELGGDEQDIFDEGMLGGGDQNEVDENRKSKKKLQLNDKSLELDAFGDERLLKSPATGKKSDLNKLTAKKKTPAKTPGRSVARAKKSVKKGSAGPKSSKKANPKNKSGETPNARGHRGGFLNDADHDHTDDGPAEDSPCVERRERRRKEKDMHVLSGLREFYKREKNNTAPGGAPPDPHVDNEDVEEEDGTHKQKQPTTSSSSFVAAGGGVLTGTSSSSSSSSSSKNIGTSNENATTSSDATRAIRFGRHICGRTGEGSYKVDGKTVTLDEYSRILKSVRILTRARNFLVFQGDVEALAQRQGLELTRFFERVCGSDQYRNECEHLTKEKKEAEENLRLLFAQKRSAVTERKQVEVQKAEAEKYRQLIEERNLLQTEFCLYRMNTVETQLRAESERANELRSQCDAAETTYRGEVKNCKKKEDDVGKVSLQLTRYADVVSGLNNIATGAAKAIDADHESASSAAVARKNEPRVQPAHAKLRSEKSLLERELAEKNELLEQNRQKQASLNSQVEDRTADLSQVQKGLDSLGKKIADCQVNFSPEQGKRYREAVRESEAAVPPEKTALLRDLEYRQKDLQAAVARRTADAAHAGARVQAAAQMEERLVEVLETAVKTHDQLDADLTTKRTKLKDLTRKLQNVGEDKDQLATEKRKILDGVQSGNLTARQVEREQRLRQVASELQESIPGVLGRVCDLCKPAQKKYRVALNVALGGSLDNVLCDTAATCRKCVMFLKARHLEPMTFIPLQKGDLRVNSATLDPRVRQGIKEITPALDILNFDRKAHANAFNYLLGHTLIVDNLDAARKVAFTDLPLVTKQRSHGCRIVTLDGEMIKANGNMTVNCDAAQEGGTKFDLQELQKAQARLEEIGRKELQLVNFDLHGQRERVDLEAEIARVDAKVNTDSSARVSRAREDLARKKHDRENVLVPAKVRLEKECADRTKELQETEAQQVALEADVQKLVGSFFTDLSKELNVEDVRALDLQCRRERERLRVEETRVQAQADNLRSQLDLLQSGIARYSIDTVQKEIDEVTEKLEKCTTDLAEWDRIYQDECNKTDDRRKRATELLEQRTKLEGELAELKKGVMARKKALAEAGKRLEASKGKMESLKSWRSDIMRGALTDGVVIPVDREQNQLPKEAELESIILETGGIDLIVDYSSLPESHRNLQDLNIIREQTQEYESELEKVKEELDSLRPNMKAAAKMDEVAAEVAQKTKEAESARLTAQRLEMRIGRLNERRRKRFMECFNCVQNAIGDVYKTLTETWEEQQTEVKEGIKEVLVDEGGRAFLDLENAEMPFEGGVKYTTMAPSKRFRDMSLLSGGEKTLAALALLFAVHAYQRPPFLLLDEVDAALDCYNVQSVRRFLQRAPFQSIIISLKDKFFSKSSALVGVYKDRVQDASGVLTLDLQKYRRQRVARLLDAGEKLPASALPVKGKGKSMILGPGAGGIGGGLSCPGAFLLGKTGVAAASSSEDSKNYFATRLSRLPVVPVGGAGGPPPGVDQASDLKDAPTGSSAEAGGLQFVESDVLQQGNEHVVDDVDMMDVELNQPRPAHDFVCEEELPRAGEDAASERPHHEESEMKSGVRGGQVVTPASAPADPLLSGRKDRKTTTAAASASRQKGKNATPSGKSAWAKQKSGQGSASRGNVENEDDNHDIGGNSGKKKDREPSSTSSKSKASPKSCSKAAARKAAASPKAKAVPKQKVTPKSKEKQVLAERSAPPPKNLQAGESKELQNEAATPTAKASSRGRAKSSAAVKSSAAEKKRGRSSRRVAFEEESGDLLVEDKENQKPPAARKEKNVEATSSTSSTSRGRIEQAQTKSIKSVEEHQASKKTTTTVPPPAPASSPADFLVSAGGPSASSSSSSLSKNIKRPSHAAPALGLPPASITRNKAPLGLNLGQPQLGGNVASSPPGPGSGSILDRISRDPTSGGKLFNAMDTSKLSLNNESDSDKDDHMDLA